MTTQPPHQPKLHYDDLDDALQDLVLALGGFKTAGHTLWPALPVDDAASRLRHCLNKSRREKLSHHETAQLMRLGRQAGFHGAKNYFDDETGYTRSEPRDPKGDELRAIEAVERAAAALQHATTALTMARQEVRTQLAVVK